MKNAWKRRPSPAMLVALAALVVATSGTALAAGSLVNGDKLIKKGTLSGSRLRNHTITGTQVNLSRLGKVPSARKADSATNAKNATNATNAKNAANATAAATATNALALGGKPSSAFLPASDRLGTNGLKTTSGSASGTTVPLFTAGPFTATMTCTKTVSGTTLDVAITPSEAGTVINGLPVATAGATQHPSSVSITTPGTGATIQDNVNLDVESPTFAAVFVVTTGVNSLNTDCWATFSALR